MMTLDPYRPEFEKGVEYLRRELQGIRTGRATPALVENIVVDAYGSKMTVKQLATITAQDAKTIHIEPWDASVVKDIERGIRLAQPTLNPVVDGKRLRVPMPDLTEDARKEMSKLIGRKVEEAKQTIRRVRDDARSAIIEAEREKEMSEDDRFRLQKQLDEMAEEFTERLKAMGEKKTAEVMTV